MKKILSGLALVPMFFLAAGIASAHVIVRPNQVGIGATQVFTMAVPSEKDIPTVAIRLMLPDGLDFVTPNVKQGWKVEVKTQATGNQVKDDDGNMVAEMKPVEIDWTGGSIPAGERDEFNFQAQVPATPTTLDWKAYQTYSDGSIVTWDQNPATMDKMTNGQMDMSKGGPYSETMVVNDLSAANSLQTKNAPAAMAPSNSAKNSDEPALAISVVALVLSLWALMKKMA